MPAAAPCPTTPQPKVTAKLSADEKFAIGVLIKSLAMHTSSSLILFLVFCGFTSDGGTATDEKGADAV